MNVQEFAQNFQKIEKLGREIAIVRGARFASQMNLTAVGQSDIEMSHVEYCCGDRDSYEEYISIETLQKCFDDPQYMIQIKKDAEEAERARKAAAEAALAERQRLMELREREEYVRLAKKFGVNYAKG